jgi:hypothetical protein
MPYYRSFVSLRFDIVAIASQERAVMPYPKYLNSNKKDAKLPKQSAEGCHAQMDGQHCPLITYQGVFFKGGENL